MIKRTTIDSDDCANPARPDLCAQLKVEIEIHASAEDDAYAEVTYIENAFTGESLELEHLSVRDRAKVEKFADDMAYEHAHEAWFEAQVARADFMDREDD